MCGTCLLLVQNQQFIVRCACTSWKCAVLERATMTVYCTWFSRVLNFEPSYVTMQLVVFVTCFVGRFSILFEIKRLDRSNADSGHTNCRIVHNPSSNLPAAGFISSASVPIFFPSHLVLVTLYLYRKFRNTRTNLPKRNCAAYMIMINEFHS